MKTLIKLLGLALTSTTAVMASPFTLGGTFDSMSEHPTLATTCLNVATNLDNMQLINPQAELTFSSTSSSSAVKNALGVEITQQIGWGAFVATSSYQYANTSQDDDYTLNLNYIYKYAGKYAFKDGKLSQGNNALTSVAQNLIKNDPVGFRKECGNNFVSEINAGISLLMKVSLNFHSKAEKNVFNDSMVQGASLNDVLNQIKINSGSGVHFNLHISGIQAGGDPELLNQLFLNSGGKVGDDGYPVLECGIGGNLNSHCTDLINQVISYATTVSDQLTDTSKYYFSNPTLAKWSSIGIFPGEVTPDEATIDAMRDLTNQYAKDENKLKFLTHYRDMLQSANLLSDSMQSNLEHLVNNYLQVLNVYKDPQNKIMSCYNGFVSAECIPIHDNILNQRARILQDESLNNLFDYLNNNQYDAWLLKSTDKSSRSSKTSCTLSPISYDSSNLYLINCEGQISGSLDPSQGTALQYDPEYNLLRINNLHYRYFDPHSGDLNFSYDTSQPLTSDFYYHYTWRSYMGVSVNGTDMGLDDLAITKSKN